MESSRVALEFLSVAEKHIHGSILWLSHSVGLSIFFSVYPPIYLSNNSNGYNKKCYLLGRLVEVFSVVAGRFVEVFSVEVFSVVDGRLVEVCSVVDGRLVEVFSVVDGRLLQTRSCFVLQLWVSISFSLHDGEHFIHTPSSSPAK